MYPDYPKNLLLHRSGHQANQLIQRLGLGENWVGAGLFSAFLGQRFERVVLADCFEFASEIETGQAKRVIEEHIPLLLRKGCGPIEKCFAETLCVAIG